jgi:hypothetical protein
MMEVCAEIDAAEATAWDRVGGPSEEDRRAIGIAEKEIGYRRADCVEVARWRACRLQRAVENEWSQPGLRLLSQAAMRDAAHWNLASDGAAASAVPVETRPIPTAKTTPMPPAEARAIPAERPAIFRPESVNDPQSAPPPKLAYSMEEAAESTSISKSALYEDIAAGLLTPKKRGARTVIPADELTRYLNALPPPG